MSTVEPTGRESRPYPSFPRRRADLVEDISGGLLRSGYETSPRVIAELLRVFPDDPMAVREVVAALTPAQRRGHRAPPSPLPPTAAGERSMRERGLGTVETTALRLLVLSTDTRTDSIRAVVGGETLDLLCARGRIAVTDGHCRFAEPGLEQDIARSATQAERIEAHGRLERMHRDRGETAHAAWHRACAVPEREPALVPRLLALAEELRCEGSPQKAFLVATEAALHGSGPARERCVLLAGAMALSAGWIEDASDLLRPLLGSAQARTRLRALTGFLVAETYLRGAVPITDVGAYRPRAEDPVLWRDWARAAATAAALCAARGARTQMRSWLAEVREADVLTEQNGAVHGPVSAFCSLLAGEEDVDVEGAASGGMTEVLRRATTGDIDGALHLLGGIDSLRIAETDPLVGGLGGGPLVAAYHAVAEILLLFWRGDISGARRRLRAASAELPLELPFAGLGVVLARRLDIATLGRRSAVSEALTSLLADGARVDRFVDEGIQAYLHGATEDAATNLRLWSDRGSPAPVLHVPGLDEIGPVARAAAVMPPELRRARRLRRLIRETPQRVWRRDYAALAAETRELRSPFVRGRVEALLGSRLLMTGEHASARRHLRAAHRLFRDAGADAWSQAVQLRLARLGGPPSVDGIAHPVRAEEDVLLSACRAAWEALLTERELEVATVVVTGAANREIAERLGVSVRTVEVHIGRIFAKLEVRSRVELAMYALRTHYYA